jgi:predicted AlkP superfamily phosphohydrolase/phosphomutase
MGKMFILGFDGAPPKYVFNKWIDELPNIKKLKENGCFAQMNTCIPPSTCVAWNVMASGLDPSHVGIYGYTKRKDFDYYKNRLVNSRDIKCERVWDILTKYGKKSIVLDVPLTYPIEKPIDGLMVSGFLTPGFDTINCTYPKSFKEEIKNVLNEDYYFDVNVGLASYKSVGKMQLIEKVYEMTAQRFKLIKHLILNKEWDLFFSVFIGTDRLEHIFWSSLDEDHKQFSENNEFKNVIKNYYIYLDNEVGKILKLLPDDVTLIIASDHGMDRMDGRFCLNDWLIKEGYLVLNEPPTEAKRLNLKTVNWSKTKAFALGAYFGRIYFNLEGREPQGIVKKEEYEDLQKELIGKLNVIKDDRGNDMQNQSFIPQEIYKGDTLNESPDLYFYFDNLRWGVNNDVGNDKLYALSTTIGSDDAGHAPKGIFIMSGKNVETKGKLEDIKLEDITPTILNQLGIEIPDKLKGEIIK